jgi:DNA-binding transcriptional regulator YiaG
MAKTRKGRVVWDASQVQALRRHLGLTQQQLAEELGARQQTISEWETGQYRPRGTSARLLTVVAERASFSYQAGDRQKPRAGSRNPGVKDRG